MISQVIRLQRMLGERDAEIRQWRKKGGGGGGDDGRGRLSSVTEEGGEGGEGGEGRDDGKGCRG